MLTRLFITFFVVCFGFKAEARIIETAHVADAIALVDDDTWFLVDLDNTLFEGAQALGHANWFYDLLNQRLNEGQSRDEAIREIYPEWIKTQRMCRVKPLEENFVPALIQMQNRGIVVMGLTHRQPSVAEATINQVRSLGFDFIKTAPSKETFCVLSKHPTLYLQGIFFIGDYNKKGELFPMFMTQVKQKPKKVVFIDDKKKNVDELEATLIPLGIEYVGVYYTAVEYAKPVYNAELADFQYKFLDQIMSNEAAQLLLEHGLD